MSNKSNIFEKVFNKVIEVDNLPEIRSYKSIDGDILWALIRFDLYEQSATPPVNSKIDIEDPIISFFEKSSNFISTILKNPIISAKSSDVLILSPFRTPRTVSKNGVKHYLNNRYDFFASIYPNNTVILERGYKKNNHHPRYFKNTYSQDYLENFTKLLAIHRSKKSFVDDVVIDKFRLFIDTHFSELLSYEIINYLFDRLRNILIYSKLREKVFKSLLKKIKPRIVFLHGASYGGAAAQQVKWTKELGINTGEFQHGIISKNSIAYNYGTNLIKNNFYDNYFVDYFMTFGNYWNNMTNIKSKKIGIGYPFLSSQRTRYSINTKTRERLVITFFSQWSVAEEILDAAKRFSELDTENKFKVILKLHPNDSLSRKMYASVNPKGVEIIKSGNVYKMINESDYVVGNYSTVLIESHYFGSNVFILDNGFSKLFIPKDLGIRFKNGAQLYELVKSTNSIKPSFKEDFWEDNWQKNYIQFINSLQC